MVKVISDEEYRRHVVDASEVIAKRVGSSFRSWMAFSSPSVTSGAQSPIEALFAVWWHAALKIRMATGRDESITHWSLWSQVEVTLDDQRYRLDFEPAPYQLETPITGQDSIFTGNSWWDIVGRRYGIARPRIGIELDGHDFHERTKEQVIYRNARDRAFQKAGWLILHFSGSELCRDPMGCADAVFAVIEDLSKKAWDRIYQTESELAAIPQ